MSKIRTRPNTPRPSNVWYLAALLSLIVGIAGAIVVSRMAEIAPEPVETFRAGGRAEVVLADEGLSILLGRGWTVGVSVRCTVLDADGERVPLTYGPSWMEVTYRGSDWSLVYETSDPQPPGRYTVACGAEGEDVEVAVAPISPPGAFFDTLLYVSLLAGFAVSVTMTVVVFILRRRSKRVRR